MSAVQTYEPKVSSVKAMLWFGTIGPLLFVLAVLVQDILKPDFNPMRHFVSHLSLGKYGWVNVLNLIVLGFSIMLFSAGVRTYFKNGTASVWGPRLSLLAGIAFVLNGIFAIDPGLGFPPGVAPIKTVHGTIHEFAGPVTFATLTAICFVFARRFSEEPEWRGWAAVSRLVGFIIPTTWVICSVLVGLDYAGVYPSAPGGLFERISLGSACIWLAITSYRMTQSVEVS